MELETAVGLTYITSCVGSTNALVIETYDVIRSIGQQAKKGVPLNSMSDFLEDVRESFDNIGLFIYNTTVFSFYLRAAYDATRQLINQ